MLLQPLFALLSSQRQVIRPFGCCGSLGIGIHWWRDAQGWQVEREHSNTGQADTPKRRFVKVLLYHTTTVVSVDLPTSDSYGVHDKRLVAGWTAILHAQPSV